MTGLLQIAAFCPEDQVRDGPPAQPPTFTEAFAAQRFQAALSAVTAVWNYLAVVGIVFGVLFCLL